MRTTCQNCGHSQPLEAGFVGDDGKRLAALTAAMQPVLARAALSYLGLFQPAKNQLRMARAVKIVQQLAALADAGTVCRDERGGVRRPASPTLWAEGIDQMLGNRGTLELPLANHNYLRKVVFGLAEQVDADTERRKEADKRVGKHRRDASDNLDPLIEKMKWLDQQKDYGAITSDDYDREVLAAKKEAGR